MSKGKVLIIENSIDVTGSLIAILRSALSLKYHYLFIFILPSKSKASNFVKENGFEVYEVPMLELSKNLRSVIGYIPFLIRSVVLIRGIANKRRITLIHVNDFYNMVMPLWKLLGCKIPYICSVNFVPRRFPFLLRFVWIWAHLIFSKRLIAVSKYVMNQLPRHRLVMHVPNPLPVEFESKTQEDREKICLFVGNYIEGKGQNIAIEAFASIAFKAKGWKLRFVGGDMGLVKNMKYKESLRKLAKKMNIDSHIEWCAFSKIVSSEYRRASIALNFSLSESFSLTVQEAMFYGCAVISSDSGGPSELIENGYSGILVPVDGRLFIREALVKLIEDNEFRTQMGINAKEDIRQKFGFENTTGLLINLYKEVENEM